MEIWRSDHWNWTPLMSYTDGRSCIIAMGENWDQVNPKKPA
ncbi:hypothetical protein [Litoreibacter roseus]|nr:hypothetical protein [Litoreibacter roseus]